MIPDSRESTSPVLGTVLSPEHQDRKLLVDLARGGVSLADPSQGIDLHDWRCWYDNGLVKIRNLTTGEMHSLLNIPGLTELSLAFDRNMNVAVAYCQYGGARLYWYDSTVSQYVTTAFGNMFSPLLVHDDVRSITNPVDDILLLYTRSDFMLCYRQQRDRYEVELALKQLPVNYRRINKAGITEKLRLQIEVVPEQF
jgi:hypothetical protein